jgi:hypothetical protein
MVNLPTRFMKDGKYTIEVQGKDGTVAKKSRVQKNMPSDVAVLAYLKNHDRIYNSFPPSQTKPLRWGLS